MNNQLKTPITIAGPNEITASGKEELDVELESFTDTVFSFSLGPNYSVNWTKSAIGTVNGSKDASKIIMNYASIYGVARFGNIWRGAIIEKSE